MRLIDADALLEKSYCILPATMSNPYGGPLVVNKEDIEDAPTVREEVGYWKEAHFWRGADGYVCSNCDCKYSVVLREKTRFCPDCGARMYEAEEKE